ncbi:MAG TPA: hypothetical protein EYP43_01790 [Thermoplasmata archaeon]|nr:hypothetical protein [Thermoplasmata archaeon]
MVFRSVRRRGGTDTIISPVWAIIPLAPFVLLTILFIAFLWSPTGLLGLQTFCMVLFLAVILVTMMWAYILYRVLRRRQAHFDRDALLRAGLMEYIEAKAREMDVNVDVELSTMRWGDSVQRMNEPRREPVLWAVLSVLIPFVIYYTLYFLSKDAGDHHWNQDGFYRQLHSCFYKLGLPPFVPPSWQPIPSRTPVLYLILTFVFYPFMIYWLYTIIVDLNRHFEMQWEVEDNLVAAIRGR